jgi:hypothetical protein
MNLNIKVEDLRRKIEENRLKHVEEFNEAMEGYREELIEFLEDLLEDVKVMKKLPKNVAFKKPVPVSYSKEYDKIYKMLGYETKEEIKLNESEFQMYVLDEWQWKEHWSHTNSFYNK